MYVFSLLTNYKVIPTWEFVSMFTWHNLKHFMFVCSQERYIICTSLLTNYKLIMSVSPTWEIVSMLTWHCSIACLFSGKVPLCEYKDHIPLSDPGGHDIITRWRSEPPAEEPVRTRLLMRRWWLFFHDHCFCEDDLDYCVKTLLSWISNDTASI